MEAKPDFHSKEKLLKERVNCVHACKKTGAQICDSYNESTWHLCHSFLGQCLTHLL